MLSVQFAAIDVPRVLPPDTTLCLYRVAQEALQNVIKHSGVKQATVELRCHGDAISLNVSDEGSRLRPVHGAACGIAGRDQHARTRAGGAWRNPWESRPDKGATVRVRVPLDRHAIGELSWA